MFRETVFLHPDLDFRVRFPEGWKTQNSRSAVVGGSPERDAIVAAELQGRGDDPKAAAAAFLRAQQIQAQAGEAFRAGNLEGYRVLALPNTRQGRIALNAAWIAHNGLIYRFTGMTPPDRYRARAAEVESVARSFRPLTPAERASIQEQRLAVARASGGETIPALVSRTGSAWHAEQVAVANGLSVGTRLEQGQPIKISIERPYRGKPLAQAPALQPVEPQPVEPQLAPLGARQPAAP
jgi:predicted Zn-dependent protease